MQVITTLNDLIVKLQAAIRDKDLAAAEAIGAEIKAINDQVALTARKVVYIANITNEPFNLTRTFGYVNIVGAKKGERYGLTAVREYKDRIVYDDKHQIPVTFPAIEVAEDIVRNCNSDAGDDEFPNSFLGVFLCAGDKPMEDELRNAENRLREFYTHLVRKADEKWSATHNYREITGAERRAATYISVKREWLFAPEANVICPACGNAMPAGAAVHGGKDGCGAIIDRKRAIEYGLIKPDTKEISDADLDALTDPNRPKDVKKTK